MKLSKRFMLVVILTVITILTIITLIVAPIIDGILKESKNSVGETSVELIYTEAKNAYLNYVIRHNEVYPSSLEDFINPNYFKVSSVTIDPLNDDPTKVVVFTEGVSCDIEYNSTIRKVVVKCSGPWAGTKERYFTAIILGN